MVLFGMTERHKLRLPEPMLVSYLFSRPSRRITGGKVYQQNDKISMHAHLSIPSLLCLLSLHFSSPHPSLNLPSAPSLSYLLPPLPSLHQAAVQ